MNLLRQIGLILCNGDRDYLSETDSVAWKGFDSPEKYILSLSPGLNTGGTYLIAGSSSHTIALPEGYTSAERLCVVLSAFGQVRVTVASPAHANSVFTLNGSTSLEATCAWNGRVTSITVTTPSATSVKLRYSLYQLPDLTDPDSFRGGIYNFGNIG